MDAVILVGGKGTRLQGVVADRPKPMADVAGRPFVEWLVLALRARGFRRVVLCTGYRSEAVANHLGDGHRLDMEIVYSHEPTPLGTGGALRRALDKIQTESFLALDGDSYCRFNLTRLQEVHRARQALATLWLTSVDDCGRYGTVEVDDTGAVRAFREKIAASQAGLINAGVCLLERSSVESIPPGRAVSIETDFLPGLIGRGLYAVVGDGVFLDIGTPEAYAMASRILQEELRLLERTAGSGRRLHRAQTHLRASADLQRQMADGDLAPVMAAADLMTETFRAGHKVMLCGNGGSAADCQHVAAELVSRLSKDFERPGLPALALTTDTSFLTGFANDCGFEGVFERQVRALAQPGDVLIGISTSGNSTNVIRAVEAARELRVQTIGLLGEGGALSERVDCAVIVPSRNTQYVQETLLAVEHILCDLVEQELFAA